LFSVTQYQRENELNLKLMAALTLAAAATAHAPAADLQNEYFAYSHIQAGQVSQYTLLSHQPCVDPRGSKLGWYRAAFTNLGREEIRACWQDVSSAKLGEAVRVCMVSSAGKVGTACRYISKAYFSDTAALPRRAKF